MVDFLRFVFIDTDRARFAKADPFRFRATLGIANE
jgi:hypothetical protein